MCVCVCVCVCVCIHTTKVLLSLLYLQVGVSTRSTALPAYPPQSIAIAMESIHTNRDISAFVVLHRAELRIWPRWVTSEASLHWAGDITQVAISWGERKENGRERRREKTENGKINQESMISTTKEYRTFNLCRRLLVFPFSFLFCLVCILTYTPIVFLWLLIGLLSMTFNNVINPVNLVHEVNC